MQAITTPNNIIGILGRENMHTVGSIIDWNKLMKLAIRTNFWEEKKHTFDAKERCILRYRLSLMSIAELDVLMFCIFDAPEMAKFKWNIDEASYRHHENMLDRKRANDRKSTRAREKERIKTMDDDSILFMFVVGGKMEMMSMIFGWFE